MKKLIESIKRHEGYRDEVYLDSKGLPTCGWGHLLWVGSKVPKEAVEAFFKQDLADALVSYHDLSFQHRKQLQDSRTRQRVVIEMLFNMNLQKVLQFKKFWAAVDSGDWTEAKKELLDSKWHRDVGKRAEELAEIFEKGGD